MSTSDCLHWIGHRYTIPTFIKEAEERGCCRKVPQWPDWLKPGESRVFLAHQDGLSAQHGVIFGYFVLGGVDAVVGGGSGKTPVHDNDDTYLAKDLRNLLRSYDGGHDEPLSIPLFCTLLEARRKCGQRPYESGHLAHDPALYLVDSLTRKIDEVFCELVRKAIEEELGSGRRKVSKKALEQTIKDRKLFDEAVRSAKESTLQSPVVPKILGRHAEARGTLVLFAQPYPVFHRIPQASFRGLIEIDGDQLIAEVAETYGSKRVENLGAWHARRVLLPYNHEPTGPMTLAALVERLAHDCETNKELARSFLKAFENVVGSKLRQNQRVKLPGFGTFLARERPARTGVNPATGEAVSIPPKTGIRFRPAEKLRQQVGSSGAAPGH